MITYLGRKYKMEELIQALSIFGCVIIDYLDDKYRCEVSYPTPFGTITVVGVGETKLKALVKVARILERRRRC